MQHCSICTCILSHTTRAWWVACLASFDARGIVYSSLMPCRMRRCLLYAPMDSWAARSLKRSHARRAECLTTRAFRRGRRHRIQHLRPYILLVAHSSATSAGPFPPLTLHPWFTWLGVLCGRCERLLQRVRSEAFETDEQPEWRRTPFSVHPLQTNTEFQR